MLGELLPGVSIANHAMAGRSSKSFLAEGRLQPVEAALQPGDLLLIQFTHNDRNPKPERFTDPEHTFPAYLNVYIETARAHGATPVLMTPIPLRQWEDGQLVDTHGAYPEVIRRVAKEQNIPLLEITIPAMQLLQEMGPDAAKPLYMNFPAGVYAAYPDGGQDDVHTQREGALFYARLTAVALREQGLV